MTGPLVNERLQRIILTYLYKKRKSGKPVVLNTLWKKHIDDSKEFRITLQYLFHDKKYIWAQKHRDIGNTYQGVLQTLENVTVTAKITEEGIEFYRKEYRDDFWKHWGLKLPMILALISGTTWLTNKLMSDPSDKSSTEQILKSDRPDSSDKTFNVNQTNSNAGDVNNEFIGRDKITNTKTVVVQNNSTPESPTLIMSTISGAPGLMLSEDKKRFTFTLYSQSATSKNINLFASFAYTNNFEDLKSYISDGNLRLVNNLSIPKNYESSKYILRDSSIHYDYLVMWCRGNYQDSDLKKTFEYNEVILYSFKTNSTSFLTGDLTIKVKDWMTKKETRH